MHNESAHEMSDAQISCTKVHALEELVILLGLCFILLNSYFMQMTDFLGHKRRHAVGIKVGKLR